jgi:hypothetical protein
MYFSSSVCKITEIFHCLCWVYLTFCVTHTATWTPSCFEVEGCYWLIIYCLHPARDPFTHIETPPGRYHYRWRAARRSEPLNRESLSCYTCCDTGPRFFQSHPKDRPIWFLLRHVRGCLRPILTQILTCPYSVAYHEVQLGDAENLFLPGSSRVGGGFWMRWCKSSIELFPDWDPSRFISFYEGCQILRLYFLAVL